jgi:predicted nucleic acid-binding protein
LASAVLVDSTIFLRLVLGEPGAEFAANLLARAEEGVEQVVTTTAAIREAFEAAVYAAASSLLDSDDPAVLVDKLKEPDVRAEAYWRARPVLDYIVQLWRTGRIQVYTINGDDMAAALEKAIEEHIPFRDALTLHVAEKVGIQKIASFSEPLRRKAPRSLTVLPAL